jgi:DNA repair protein RecO (recombination protein O)
MPARNDQAIVLRLSDYSETSQIVTLFGAAEGLLRVIAKGARRSTKQRFATGMDLLEYGEIAFVPARGDSQLGTLTEWVQRDTFTGLRSDLVRLYGGLYAAELVGALTEEADPHPELFDVLLALLRALANPEGPAPTRLMPRFQFALLRTIGYAPELTACVMCRRAIPASAPAFFSPTAGGLLCRDCEKHHPERRSVPPRVAGERPGARDPVAWFDLFDYYTTHLAGRRFKTATELLRLLRAAAAPL